jgi:hypothetical protein
LLGLRRFQRFGHHPIALAGGATGLIGDPSGKASERQLLTRERLESNIAGVKEQLRRLLDFETTVNPARLLDNATWTVPVSFLDFLRDIGKHFSVNMMVSKESVRARMEDREAGISYTEFSYMLLQAFDFYVLRRDQNCGETSRLALSSREKRWAPPCLGSPCLSSLTRTAPSSAKPKKGRSGSTQKRLAFTAFTSFGFGPMTVTCSVI